VHTMPGARDAGRREGVLARVANKTKVSRLEPRNETMRCVSGYIYLVSCKVLSNNE
jgi:hypothetical protein